MDDLLSVASNFEEMIEHIRDLLITCRKFRLKINASKCAFFKKEVIFLGYQVSSKGIQIAPEKLQAISQLKAPTSQKTLQAFVGYVNYFRKLLKSFSSMIQPFQHLLLKDAEWAWGPEQQKA